MRIVYSCVEGGVMFFAIYNNAKTNEPGQVKSLGDFRKTHRSFLRVERSKRVDEWTAYVIRFLLNVVRLKTYTTMNKSWYTYVC